VARWAISIGLPSPWGTFVANVLGSFLLAALLSSPLGRNGTWKALLGTGVLGGFTTYSTFNYEVLTALENQAWGAAVVTALGTLAVCLVAGAAGLWCGSLIGE
jgi:CrcB protein